jgi:hypothetical protein
VHGYGSHKHHAEWKRRTNRREQPERQKETTSGLRQAGPHRVTTARYEPDHFKELTSSIETRSAEPAE